MATYTKHLLSGSTGGAPIQIVSGSIEGELLHSTTTSSTTIDEIWIYANNIGTSDVELTIEYGGIDDVNKIIVTIPSKSGLVLVTPGLLLTGDGTNARWVTAIASSPSVINISGYVNRIS